MSTPTTTSVAANIPPPEPGASVASDAAPALGRTVGGGVSWLIVATILSKGFTSIAQVALGWLLSAEEFGLFAQATAAYGILSLLRDGGATSILMQRGPKEYLRVSGSLFWMGIVLTSISFVGLALIAWPLAKYWYQQPAVTWLLIVMAFSMPMGMPGYMLLCKLRMDLRFAEYSRQQTWSALVRQICTVLFAASGLIAHLWGAMLLVLAWGGAKGGGTSGTLASLADAALSWGGLGAMSLALPTLVIAAFDFATAYRLTRDRPWSRPAETHTWRGYWEQGKWVIFGTMGNVFLDWGPFFVMGRMMAERPNGIFFFAYQITAQIGVLLGWGLQQVLTPVLTLLDKEPERQRQAMVRSLHAMMLIGSCFSVGLAVVIDPIEDLIWRGKWAESVLPVVILGLAYPWRITFGLTSALLQAQGRFKRFCVLAWAEGLGLMGATAAACFFDASPVNVALWTGGWLIVARFAITAYVLRRCGTRRRDILEALMPAWMLSLIAAGITFWADGALGLERLLIDLAGRVVGAGNPGWARTGGQLTRAMVLGLICTAAFAILVRIMLAHQVRDALSVAPSRLRGAASKLLRL